MEYIAEIYSLSHSFYAAYPAAQFPEISRKNGRPYSCLLLEYMDDLFICIPFRSNVPHKYGFHFKKSVRSQTTNSGLDFTKTVIIKDNSYLDTSRHAVVDQDEYNEVSQNIQKIANDVFKYISAYRDDLNGVKKLHPKEWNRRYGKSTLPYFDNLLKTN